MLPIQLQDDDLSAVRDILGYLNFSSGNRQPHFAAAWNRLFQVLEKGGERPVWQKCGALLLEKLDEMAVSSDAFRHAERARFVLTYLYERLIPAYREFHRDILFHQTDEFLLNPFFLARLCRLIVTNESLREDEKALTAAVIRQANDFLGYRPVPVLEGEEKHEPNPHEWVGAVPLYLRETGTAAGPYSEIVAKTIEILRSTDPVLLRDAWFDPDKLDELAIDPRAFDFDHPVNRRPNYHFGTWDPHVIDENGYFRRFIIHQVTIDGILQRVKDSRDAFSKGEIQITVTAAASGSGTVVRQAEPVSERDYLNEAAAILAGTMLMGSGITGDHVQTHDSTVTLSTLMPQIASYRDRFYELLIQRIPEPARTRLEEEAKRLFQPFGAARQDLNKRLARKRADQLLRLNLARLYARMGYFEAARRQTEIISVASARILCRIDCLITQSYFLADGGHFVEAAALLAQIEDLLHRGIACGALPDPWSLLGFGAQYSLFPSADNTIHDHRVDDLINLLNDIFDLYSRLLKEAAASGDENLQADLSDRMSDLAGWWDQFGSLDVSSVEGFSGQAVWESAAKVATALAVWHKAGTAAGDVAFWSRHVARFSSPKAYVLLGEALLDRTDPISSMALLMHWLDSADSIPLIEGDYSFHSLTFRWMEDLWERKEGRIGRRNQPGPFALEAEEYLRRWTLTRTFLERLEANAGEYWDVPTLEIDPDLLDEDQIDDWNDDFDDIQDDANGSPQDALRLSDIFGALDSVETDLKEDPDFQEFIQQEIKPSEIDDFVNFMKRNLVREIVRFFEKNPNARTSDVELPPETKFILDMLSHKMAGGRSKGKKRSADDSALEIPDEADDPLYQKYFSRVMPPEEYYKYRDELESLKDEEDDEESPLFDSNDSDEGDERLGIDPTCQAAYDQMVFRDSAEDGVEDEMMESGFDPFSFSEDELADETDRINDRLAFTFSLMKLWKYAAGKSPLLHPGAMSDETLLETRQLITGWLQQARRSKRQLERLLRLTSAYRIAKPRGTSESLMEYDQQHGTKEILLDRIIRTSVEVEDAILFLDAVLGGGENSRLNAPETAAVRTLAAMFRSDVKRVKRLWPGLLESLRGETLLYIPTSRGGEPGQIVHCRYMQQTVLRLLEYAPRLGLLTETFQLLATVQQMDRIRPNRPGAITEFDRIFETATRAVAQCIADSSRKWRLRPTESNGIGNNGALIWHMERAMDLLLSCWLSHSQQIRISSVEGILPPAVWDKVKEFIQKYGSDLFTQNFLSYRNLRAILVQGVENYLRSLLKIKADGRDLESGERLVDDLANERIPMNEAVFHLEHIFECVAENYSEYIDYNSTTTHSDHGEKLYMLLDMFRVLAQYERVAWNLKPVYWVHQTLIRSGHDEAAAMWESNIGKKSVSVAEENLRNYADLGRRYGIWLPSIHERLSERFVRPLQIDRMCGLIPESIREAKRGEDAEVFRRLEKQVEFFVERQSGIGFETPEWLNVLQDEVADVQDASKEGDAARIEDAFNPGPVFEPILLPRADLKRQILWSLDHISFSEPAD